jgi:multiple sugar transport system ATP-binding protein
MKLSNAEIDEQVKAVAESLSITDILNHYPDSLAGGQKQRVSLARALVRNPSVFLMDEPLSHVDADVRYRARAEIKHMQAVSNATIIYVTHDQVEAVALADRVVVMDLGVIQQIGTPADLYKRPANLFVAGFIGEPPMNLIPCKLDISENMLKLAWGNEENIVWRYSEKDVPKEAMDALIKQSGKEVIVGVRPQRIKISPPENNQTSGSLSAKLVVQEFLGKNGIAQMEVDHTVIESVIPPIIPYSPGDTVTLKAEFEDLNFFDPASTLRISY